MSRATPALCDTQQHTSLVIHRKSWQNINFLLYVAKGLLYNLDLAIKEIEKQASLGHCHVHSDIAVIDMSCRVAGANSSSELWDVLTRSNDVRREITRFNTNGFYHPKGASRKGLTNVKHTYMMYDNAIDCFDNAFFYVPPVEAAATGFPAAYAVGNHL